MRRLAMFAAAAALFCLSGTAIASTIVREFPELTGWYAPGEQRHVVVDFTTELYSVENVYLHWTGYITVYAAPVIPPDPHRPPPPTPFGDDTYSCTLTASWNDSPPSACDFVFETEDTYEHDFDTTTTMSGYPDYPQSFASGPVECYLTFLTYGVYPGMLGGARVDSFEIVAEGQTLAEVPEPSSLVAVAVAALCATRCLRRRRCGLS